MQEKSKPKKIVRIGCAVISLICVGLTLALIYSYGLSRVGIVIFATAPVAFYCGYLAFTGKVYKD